MALSHGSEGLCVFDPAIVGSIRFGVPSDVRLGLSP
jgi:hypothetical protein